MYTSFFYWQGGEFIEFLQNKYLPTLQLAPRLIQVSVIEQNSSQCQILSLGDKLLQLSQMGLAVRSPSNLLQTIVTVWLASVVCVSTIYSI